MSERLDMNWFTISVNGKRVKFKYKDGVVQAPGVITFKASSLAEARNTVRSLFSRESQT